MRRVAIIGAAQTRFEARKASLAYNELVYGVVRELLDRTGVSMREIESMVTASQDAYDGKTISGMAINEVVGAYLKSEAKVAADGLQALLYGVARILSGEFDLTLVVAHCKESEGQPSTITGLMFDPFVQRPLGLDELTAAALQARRYCRKRGLAPEDVALVAVKAHHQGLKNPYAQRAGTFTVEDVLASPILADPIHELEAAPRSDGACAVLLASEWRARRLTDRPVYVVGIGNCTDAYWTERDLAEARALQEAARRAYAMAGIGDPAREIDVVELSARYAYEELMAIEALGLHTSPVELITQDRAPFVNPSGGPLCGNPPTVSGLARVVEAYWQLREEAGERQIPGARVALAHGAGGICGQNQTVVILRRA